MIHPSRDQFPTTAQIIAAANARVMLESEPMPAFDLAGANVICTNPDASPGQRNFSANFIPASGPIQTFDGRHWVNFPR